MVKPTCRFCSNPVRQSGGICFTCRMEGRDESPGLPMQADEELQCNQVESAQRVYHGDTTRDDL